jgi:hypothetical protein
MKEILLPPPAEELLEPSPKESESLKVEKPELKEQPTSKPLPPVKPDLRPELRPSPQDIRPLPAAESSSKKESQPESVSKPEIGSAQFKPARTAILRSSLDTEMKPADLKGVATFTPTEPKLRAEFVPATPQVDPKLRLALLLQPVVRSYQSRKALSTASEKKVPTSEASERIQRSARRWLFLHRRDQRVKAGGKMAQDEAARVIQERTRRWLDSTGFAEAKKARKHKKKHGKKQQKEEQPTESKLEHFGRLVREARGELPESSATASAAPAAPAHIDITDKAHLSAPAKAHLVEMIQTAAEAIKNIDESKLPKATAADLFRPVPEPSVVPSRPEPTHTQQESGAPGHYIQQPRA